MALLAQTEIQSAADKLDGWTYSDNAIHKTTTFDSYMDGIGFVNQLLGDAEAINHHPDLTSNRWMASSSCYIYFS